MTDTRLLHYNDRQNYTVSQKYMSPFTNFKNSSTGTLCGKCAVTQLLNIPPHLYCVAIHYLVKNKFSKIAIIRINIYVKTYLTKQFSTNLLLMLNCI